MTDPGANRGVVVIAGDLVSVTVVFDYDPDPEGSTLTFSTRDGSMVSNGLYSINMPAEITPLLGQAPWTGGRTNLFFYNRGSDIWAFQIPFLANSTYGQSPAPAGSGGLARGLALYDGILYVGGNNGILYSLDDFTGHASFTQLTQAAVTDGGFTAGPIVVPDGQGGAVIAFSGQQGNNNSVWIDDLGTGNLAKSAPTRLATQLQSTRMALTRWR